MRPDPPGPCRRGGTLAAVLLAVAALAALAACGDDDGSATATTTSTSEATSTTSSTTSTTDDDAEAPAACPEGRAPRGELREAPVPLDSDGDEAPDEVSVHVLEPGTVEVVLAHGAGGRSVLEVADENVSTFADVRVTAVADVDDDGDDDAWVVVGAGASVEIATLVLVDGCDLVRAEVDGRGSAFAFGASVGHLAGIECAEDGTFRTYEAENAGETAYRGTMTTWSVGAGGTLEQTGTEPYEVDLADPGQARYTTLDCS